MTKVIYNEGNIHMMAEDIKRDFAKAYRATVNMQVALTRRGALRNIADNFTIRNNFTKRQVQFTQMPEGDHQLSDIQASIGVTEDAGYMRRQEEGGDRRPRQGQTLPIPTDFARGGSHRRPVLKPMRVSNVRNRRRRVHGESSARLPQHRGKGKNARGKLTTHTRASNFVSRAYIAFKHGLFMPMGGNKEHRNLHKVVSFRKRGRDNVEFETRQVYRFDMDRTHTPAQPWLWPATEKVAKDGQRIFNSQAKKLGL